MKRRKFIGLYILVALGSLVGIQISGFRKTCKHILQLDTNELYIKTEAVDQFMADAETEYFWDEFSFFKKLFIVIQHPLIYQFNIQLPYFDEYLVFRNRVTGQFLLSTNLFYDSPGAKREIAYRGYHNPYIFSCSNPFVVEGFQDV